MKGRVIKNTGSWYTVLDQNGQTHACRVKGNLRLKGIKTTNPVAVGDLVTVSIDKSGSAVIENIEERKNYIIRKATNLSKQTHILATNIDQCFLLITVCKPATTTVFIDRFLASAQAYKIPVVLVFNKTDRYDVLDTEYMNALIDLYSAIGYKCYAISALKKTGVEELKDVLRSKITLFSGHSGVGKSTLINCLLPNASQKTGAISEYHSKGVHTTTFSEMLALPHSGFIIDTPGIKGFGMVDMEANEIDDYFPEIFETAKNCRFHNCLHINEPGCAVLDAVEHHSISESRYKSYLNILEDSKTGKYR